MKKNKLTSIIIGIVTILGISTMPILNHETVNEAKAAVTTYHVSFDSALATANFPVAIQRTAKNILISDVAGVDASNVPGKPTLHFDGYLKTSLSDNAQLTTTSEHPNYATLDISFDDSPNYEYTIKSYSITFGIRTAYGSFTSKQYVGTKFLDSHSPKISKDTSTYTINADPGDHITKIIDEVAVNPSSSTYGSPVTVINIYGIDLTYEKHTMVTHAKVNPTCTKSGTREYVTCGDDQYKYYRDDNNNLVTFEDDSVLVLEPTGHNWKSPASYTWSTDEEHNFTCMAETFCTNPGCSERLYSDAKEITQKVIALPTATTLGRASLTATFDNPTVFPEETLNLDLPTFGAGSPDYNVDYQWQVDQITGEYQCTASLYAVIFFPTSPDYGLLFLTTEAATVTNYIYVAPTCVSTGIRRYVATFNQMYFAEGSLYDVEMPIEPDAHDWGEPSYEWSFPENDVPHCTATIVCNLDEFHIDIIEGITYSEVRTAPTPATPGKIIYIAKFFDDRCEDQEIVSDVPPLNPIDFNIRYVWQLNGDGEYICTGYATKKDDSSVFYTETGTSKLIVEKKCTCSEDGYGHYESTFVTSIFEKQVSTETVIIPSPGEHVYYDYWVYDKLPTTTETGLRSHHCMYCDHFIDQESVPVLTAEAEKETAKSIIRPEDPVEEAIIDEALDKIAQEDLDEITDLVNTTMNDLNEQLEQAKMAGDQAKIAECEAKIEITQAVTKSSVVISSEKQDNIAEGEALSKALPEDSPIDLENIFDDFIERQMDLLLNKNQETKKSKSLLKDSKDTSEGINFDISAETYNNAIEFVNDSIDHMEDAAVRIRECSCEELTVTMEVYIYSIQYSTFQDFDKEAADAEFVENAYSAIMLQMQSEVVAQLELELEKTASQIEKDPAKEKLIKEQIDAVKDIEQFEIMVMEILREQYAALTGYDVTLEEFEPVYRTMFKRWALNEEQDVDITLDELTNAVVDKKVNKDTTFNISFDAPGQSEIILLATLGGAIILGIAGAIVGTTIYKKKHKKEE